MIRGTIAAILLAVSATAFAANPAPATATANVTTAIDADSRQTREEFKSLMRRYPPELGEVLKLDPSLFGNETYVANYPALATFVKQDAAVAHNPSYFLEFVNLRGEHYEPDPPNLRMWHSILGDIAGFVVFLVVTSVLIWAVKTLIEQR